MFASFAARQARVVAATAAFRTISSAGVAAVRSASASGNCDPLVHADRPVEDDALVGVRDGTPQRRAPDPERLGGEQDALRVEPVEQVA